VRAGAAFVEVFTNDTRLKRGLARAAARVKAFGRQMTDAGSQLLKFGATAAAPLALAAKVFADFDDQMRAVKAVTQSTGEEFVRLTNKAKELGRTTSFTAGQVAGIMTELGRAGFAADQIEEMTGAVLDLARATGTDAVQSSGIMAATLRQFGMGAHEATRAADALTVAANKSFNTVESLGESLSYAGPVAADFGMSLEDTLAVLGALGNAGIQGSSAGTAIRRLLTLSAVEAEKFKEMFGVEMADAAGNLRPLVDVLDEINEATKDLGTAERGAKFGQAFGLLGVTSASVIGKSATSVRELREALDDAEGTAARTAKEMDSGIGGAFRKFMSAAEGVAIAVGDRLAPMLMRLADWLTLIAGKVTAWVDANPELIEQVALITAGVLGAGAALVAAGTAAAALGAIFAGLAAVVGVVGSLLGTIFSPVGIAVAAVVALLAVFFTQFETGRQLAGRFADAWSDVVGVFAKAWGGITAAIQKGDLKLAFEIAVAGLKVVWWKAMIELRKAWDGLGAFMIDVWKERTLMIKNAIFDLIDFARRNGKLLVKALFGGSAVLYEMLAGGGGGGDVSAEVAAARAALGGGGGGGGLIPTVEELTANMKKAEDALNKLIERANRPDPVEEGALLAGLAGNALRQGFDLLAGLKPQQVRKLQEVGEQVGQLAASVKGVSAGSGNLQRQLGIGEGVKVQDQILEENKKQNEKLDKLARALAFG
jgi:TP901 family phage tail tape measure protein